MDDSKIAEMRAGVESAPEDPWAHYNLGVAYDQAQQTEEALAAYEHALTLNPDMNEARFNQSMALLELGQVAPARAALEQFTSADPSYPPGWFMLGHAAWRGDPGCPTHRVRWHWPCCRHVRRTWE